MKSKRIKPIKAWAVVYKGEILPCYINYTRKGLFEDCAGHGMLPDYIKRVRISLAPAKKPARKRP